MAVLSNFNPRPPCGGRQGLPAKIPLIWIFQSTSPVRGTTKNTGGSGGVSKISIHVPRAGDDCAAPPLKGGCAFDFNPRPPCGGRPMRLSRPLPKKIFQSTSPVRGTTAMSRYSPSKRKISIHVPRAGDDRVLIYQAKKLDDFNPRPPCGGRR